MRGVLAGCVALAVATNAAAQAPMTEAQKRRALLPTIKTATDCIARETLKHPSIVSGYRSGDISTMLGAAWKECAPLLVQIAARHDELHGQGSGIQFVTGAYQSDLPRAVTARIRDEMSRRIAALEQAETAQRAEQARLEAERQQNMDRLERAAQALRDRIYDCTGPQLEKLVASAETADVLATAAMTICRKEIDDAIEGRLTVMRTQFGTNYIWSNEATNRENFRKGVRESVITTAVQLKANGSAPPVVAPRATVPASVEPKPASSPFSAGGANLPKELRECLSTVATARNGQFINQRKLYEAMLELCRPEIEAAARTAFLGKKDGDLMVEREKAITDASTAAKAIIGMVD